MRASVVMLSHSPAFAARKGKLNAISFLIPSNVGSYGA